MIKIKKGLNLPISGDPAQTIDQGKPVSSVALLGHDYPGLKPTFEVATGDQVKAGQVLFTDKKNPGIYYTAPASGMVSAINRGAKRAFQSVVIDIEEEDGLSFNAYSDDQLNTLGRQDIVDNLLKSGQWTALRTRPYSKIPAPDTVPHSLFVTMTDSRPLAPDPLVMMAEQREAFVRGLKLVSRLTEGEVYICAAPEAEKVCADICADVAEVPRCKLETISGVHPAGLVGTHIHFLDPVYQEKTVWHIGYQDVIAVGHLFATGKLYFDRVISIGGPGVLKPRLVRTRLGACTDEILANELKDGDNRAVSGSVLDGCTAAGGSAFLGRYHNQVSVLSEGRERELLGFIMPGLKKFSLTRLYMSAFTRMGKKLDLTTSTGGSERAMVPLGTFEDVMPLDILPTQLLRALLVGDVDNAQELGCLELDEEDLALCAFACPGKYEYGPYLREMLTRIETEG